jgi:hypothetical protein
VTPSPQSVGQVIGFATIPCASGEPFSRIVRELALDVGHHGLTPPEEAYRFLHRAGLGTSGKLI